MNQPSVSSITFNSHITINLKSIDYDNISIFWKKFLKSDKAIGLYILIFNMKFSKKIEKSKNKSRDVDISSYIG